MPEATVPRALVIALGGTGKQMLVDVRRRICERFGSVEAALPCQRYLYLDTDGNDIGTSEARLGDPEAVNLAPASKIHISVTQVRNLRQQLSSFPHIAKWIPESALNQDITQGAGAIRARGRLGLCWNIETVRNAIQRTWGEINAADMQSKVLEASNQRAKLNPSLPARVYLLSSLRGGTGAGIFIDLAYLVRKILGAADYKLIGVFIMPGRSAQYGENAANAHAALQELNHWNYDDTEFFAEYGSSSVVERVGPTAEPPLNYCYLVEPVNRVGNTISDAQLIAMCGQAVFLDLIGEDVIQKGGSFRDNFDVYLQQFDNVGNPQYYLSLGVAMIRFPRDRAIRALSNRLAAQVLDTLVHGSADEQWSAENLREHAIQALRQADLSYQGLSRELGLQAHGEHLLDDLDQEVNDIFRELRDLGFPADLPEYAQAKMDQFVREKVGNISVGIPPDQRDPQDLSGYIRHVHERYSQLKKQALEKVDTIVRDFVNNPRLRLSLASKAVVDLIEILEDERGRASAEFRSSRQEAAAPSEEQSQYTAEAEFRSIEQALHSPFVLSLPGLPKQFATAALRRYVDRRADVVRRSLGSCLAEYSEAVLGALVQHLKDWREHLNRLSRRLENGRQKCATEGDKAAHPTTEVFGKELWDPGVEIDELYSAAVVEDKTTAEVLAEFKEERRAEDDFAAIEQLAEDDEALSSLVRIARRPFEQTLNEQDITERLMEGKDQASLASELEELITRQSQPYIQLRTDYPDWHEEPAKKMRLVGVSDKCKHYNEIVKAFGDKLVDFDRDRELIKVDDRSYILARQEICGFPLAATHLIGHLEQAAAQDTAGTPRYSRIDVTEWRDFRRPSSVAQFDAFTNLVAAWLGGLISPDVSSGENEVTIRFSFEYESFEVKSRLDLGHVTMRASEGRAAAGMRDRYYGPQERLMPKSWSGVLQGLANHTEALNWLKQQVEDRIKKERGEFVYNVEQAARKTLEEYPVLRAHMGPATEQHDQRGPLRLALDQLWEKHGFGKRQPVQGPELYRWEWTDEEIQRKLA